MEAFVVEIIPRQDQDTPVMNVKVKFWIPETDRRNNTVEVIVFIDKTIDSMAEINHLALEKAYDILRKIIGYHS